ncbi:MAG: hypothetical protein KBB21_36120 [Nannocystaceae bacterium]|nr:hypothetical protein [Deltaproteobacteria bacterium]MBP7292109.1 hypothetical protein [Nannocystaceae bacterium]
MLSWSMLSLMLAAAPSPPPEPDPYVEQAPEQIQRSKRDFRAFQLYGYFLTRAEITNVAPANDLFKGQVVGRLFGPNTTTTSRERAVFLEQRLIPFLVVEPALLNRRARLRASFELDWTFGDTSNSAGGNFGSSITADQVNLQTQNVAVEIDLWKGWSVDVGLQRLYDSAYDPYRTPVSTMQLTGTRLAMWGTDAVGAVLHGTQWGQRFKLGAYQLYENLIQKDDDVSLFEFATDRHLGKTLHAGASFRYLRDTSTGQGGVGILGQGPDSTLVDYAGGYRFTIPDNVETWRGRFAWLAGDVSYNPELTAGRFGGSAFAVGNFGQIVTAIPNQPGDFQKLTNVLGLAANVRAAFRFGRTPRDAIVADLLYTSGDKNGLEDGTYSGVVTGNTWGAPAAPFTTFGTYLLLPHGNVVNRFYAAATDISNAGYGMMAASLGVSYDFLRNRLTGRIGTAFARSNVQPIDGAYFMGAEVNGSLSWRIRPLLSVEAHAAYLRLGDFFASSEIVSAAASGGGSGRPRDPWTGFLTLKWLMI